MRLCLRCQTIHPSQSMTCPACGHAPAMIDGVAAYAPNLMYEGGGFKSEYFVELARLEAANFWFRARNALLLWALGTYYPSARSFLEVGCGTGFVLSAIAAAYPEMKLSGSEIFLAGLSHAMQRLPDAALMQMDARKVPFVEEFDVIGAFDVLEHIEEDECVLEQLHRAANPGALLLVTVPQHRWLWSDQDEYACHVRRYTAREIESKVRAAGFNVVRSTSFVTTLLPAMLVARRVNRGKQTDPTAELKLNHRLNSVFEHLLRLELAGIRVGLNYPIGGTRLIVARK
jgi:SAM-dependent methyltransferase